MKERPILFSGPMVRAIIEGRKTQTRRVVKRDRIPVYLRACLSSGYGVGSREFNDSIVPLSPYGIPGDRLWVRESFAYLGCSPKVGAFPWGTNGIRGGDFEGEEGCEWFRLSFAADGDECPEHIAGAEFRGGWHPSIHMPRWVSRVTLEVTSIRVDRVQDISEEDAEAEGIQRVGKKMWKDPTDPQSDLHLGSPVTAFKMLWDSINDDRGFGWDEHPWVWVVSFKVVKP